MNYIGINGLLPAISLPAQIYGQNPGVGWINLSNCQPLMDGSTFSIVRPINPLASLNVQAVFMNGSADQYYGIQYKNVVSGREYKVVTFTFEFAAMRDMGDQAITAYKVVNWLSGLGNRTGEDLAVASQYIVPINPRYMQPVNISATVRNNGASVQANVEVVAYIYVNGALLDTVSPVNTSITLQPDGGSQLVNFTWVPRMVGTYVIRVVVDPNNKVTETNEDNNALSTAVGIHEINVLYTLLVVDDDSSAENGGGGTLPNVAQYVIDALTSLGYVNGTDMDIQKVPRGADRNNTEYNVTNYNCILWVTGFASNGSGYNTLTSTDMQIIKDFYLPSDPAQHTFILIGREVLGDSGVSGTAFMTQVLGAASAGTKYTDGVGKVVYGVKESPVTNGMRVEYTNGTSFPCYAYTKTASAIPLFWANGTTYWDRTTDLVMGTGVKDISGWHSAFLSFDLSYTTNFSLVKEILFNLIHWGGRVDAIPELRVTSPDIYAGTNSRPYIILPELNPQIGSSYLLKANITNVGGLSGDVIVRFLDGDTIINSVNIHVPESYADASNNVYNGKCVAEIIWTPLYAGYERISAIIDPDNLYVGSEKLRENNNASQQIQVFFFYDDMEVPERTAENWNHDATLLNINGESPLDFLARKDVSTRVIGDWDWNVSGSQDFNGTTTFNGNGTYLTNNATVLNYTGGAAHTTPTAYWLPETQGRVTIKRNADVIMMFDVSGSMSWDLQTRMYAAKAAGGILLDTLNEGDRAALARFNTQSYLNIRFTSNLGTVRQSVLSLFPGGGTAFLDATAVSVRYATGVPSTWSWANNFNYNDHNTSNFPAAIVLTDGQTNSDQTFTTYDSCISEITKYDVALFTIAFGGDADRANMWRLAYAMNHTGKSNANYSKHFNVSTPAELITAFKEISAIIKEAAGGDVRVPLLAPTKVRPKAVETVYAQNFELGSDWSIGGTGASWAVGQPTTWVGGAHSGTRCAATNLGGNYNDGEASWFCSPLINLTAYKNGNVTLTFWAAYNFYHWSYYWAGYPYRDYYDHALLQVSIDGGVTWTVLHSFPDENADGNGQLASWRQYTINLTQYVGKEIYLRFTMQDDDNVVYSYSVQGNDRNSGIYIDDITITAERGENDGVDIGYTLFPAHYRFLTTPAVRVGTPYLSFWNYASGSYETGNLPDHVVVIDYENHYYWLYNDTGAVAFEGNFVVLQNNSYTGNASKTGALNVAPVTCLYNPTPSQDVWFNINDYYGWKIFSLPAVPHAVTDMLIAWEDLWGTVPNNQIDGNGDQWVRVTLLDDGTFRVVPYRASGGYEHDFFIGSDWVYIKHHGEAWSNGAGTSADPYKEVTVVPSGQRFPVFMRKSEGGILSFYTKYSITPGTNGGFLYLWGSTDGRTWVWDRNHRVYLSPRQPYNGNLKMDALTNETTTGGLTGNGWIDIDGKMPYWCFNGKSAGGTYGWEKIEVDLAKYVRTFASIRIVFVFAQFGGMLPPEWRPDMGWYIDDVQIRVRGGVPDYWKIVENASQARSGSRFWYFNSPSDYLPLGVDSSLYTIPIDLTRAYRATLIAFFKFNINDGAGLPPDGVRVEVSKDNGETWYSITYGVRIGWGYTGRDLTTVENRGYYGVTGDATGGELPQRYSGVRGTLYKTNWTFVRASDANTVSAYDWVPSFTLVRLNCDLSGFAGNTIILRIRVFTNATGSETDAVHYASASYNKGVFVDDVFVIGNSIIHGLQGGGERCARP
ncbi:MAG: CARDB domain-containing protein [Thermoplasmata archaeon]